MGGQLSARSILLLACLRSSRLQILHHPQKILVIFAAEFHFVHALPHKMQPQAAGTYLLQRTSLELLWIGGFTGILKQDFQAAHEIRVLAPELVAAERDRESRTSLVGVANHVGHGLVDRAHDRPQIGFREMHGFRRTLQRGPHQREGFRIALQLQPQQQFRMVTISVLAWLVATLHILSWDAHSDFRLRAPRKDGMVPGEETMPFSAAADNQKFFAVGVSAWLVGTYILVSPRAERPDTQVTVRT